MIMILSLSTFAVASAFTPSHSGITDTLLRQKALHEFELGAIPKREPKKNPFQIKASAFMQQDTDREKIKASEFIQQDTDREKTVAESEAFEVEMFRQKLEYESYLEQQEANSIELSKSDFMATIGQPAEKKPLLGPVWQARILLILSAMLYGTNFTFVKVLNDNIPVQVGTSLRFSLAAIATLPWMFQKSKEIVETKVGLAEGQQIPMTASTGAIIGGIEIGLWNAIGYLSQAVGLETTPASTSAFICSLAVVVVPILDFLSGKKILSREVIGALFAVVGVGFLELDGLSAGVGAGSGPLLSTGDLFTLVQPLAFGMGFWRVEHYMRKYPSSANQLTAAQLSAIALSSIACFLYTSGFDGLPDLSQWSQWLHDPTIIGAVCWTGLITTGLTVYMETLALKTLSAAETTMLFSTEPIFGGICASAVLGETFGVGGLVGAALVLSGCLYSNMGNSQNEDGDDCKRD